MPLQQLTWLANSTEKSNYFGSIGYTEQDGHMIDEFYERINGRFNFSSSLTDWFKLDFQSFVTISEWGPQILGTSDRFIEPFATPYDENGEIVQRPYGNPVNPLIEIEAENEDKRLNLGANITGNIFLPIKKVWILWLITKDFIRKGIILVIFNIIQTFLLKN